MKTSFPPLLHHFLTYSLGALLIRGISFIILPLIMHKIPPAEYGSLSLLTAFTAVATAILGLGLRQVLSIEYFHADARQQSIMIQHFICIYTALAVPSLLVLWYARTFIIKTFFFECITALQLLAVLITIFLFFYSELLYQLWQYQQAARRLALLQCLLAVGMGGCTLFLVFVGGYGITGIVWSQAIGAIAAALIGCAHIYRHHYATITWPSKKECMLYVWYGLPFIPGTLASWILASADRWVLGYFATMREVGIYAVADLASQLFYTIILQSWASSYLPYIMQRYHAHPQTIAAIERENHRVMWGSMLGLTGCLIVGYPIAYLTPPYLLPPAYHEAVRYAFVLAAGQIFLLGSYFAAALIQYTKHTYFLACALFIPALFNLLLNCIVTPWWGIMGCALATFTSYMLYFSITYYYNKKIVAQSAHSLHFKI